ncbi:MAG: hypothetical protein HY690_16760 [Chloroflexi bacterium]|nr:hypothetical protein [Chloroflexota bacterium]
MPQGENPRERAGQTRPVQCRECTIFIGEDYQEKVPIPAPDGKGVVCWRCYESLVRTAERQATQSER